MKYEEKYREMEGNMKRISTKGIFKPLSDQFLSHFMYSWNHPWTPRETWEIPKETGEVIVGTWRKVKQNGGNIKGISTVGDFGAT